ALTNALNNSKVMVIPSIWEEPFGIVALEGLASGCIVACSDRYGLREATGGNAFFFDPEISESMLSAMSNALVFEPDYTYHKSVEKHLQKHTRASIAEQYIRFFENTCI
ncbi:glycosyltransferase, partial [Acinetobacter baumannii]